MSTAMVNEPKQEVQRKAATRTAIVLALVALAFYLSFFVSKF